METIQAINWIIVFCRMYVIVEFALDGSIALIHEKWMTTEKSCMWPASKSAMKIDKAWSQTLLSRHTNVVCCIHQISISID